MQPCPYSISGSVLKKILYRNRKTTIFVSHSVFAVACCCGRLVGVRLWTDAPAGEMAGASKMSVKDSSRDLVIK